ncbi:unnamed protein product, partial [Ixodes persulcatus]
ARRVPRPSAAASRRQDRRVALKQLEASQRRVPRRMREVLFPSRLLPLRVHLGKNRFPFAVKERVRNVEDKMSRAPAASSIRPAGAVGADLQDACLGTVFSEALPAGTTLSSATVGYYYYYSCWRQK